MEVGGKGLSEATAQHSCMEGATAAASPPHSEDGWRVKECLERTWVCKGGLKDTRGITTWAGLCVNGGGEESLEILYLIQKRREAQGSGAVGFPGRLYLKVKGTVWKR